MIWIKNIFKNFDPPELRKVKRKENLLSVLSGLLAGLSFPPLNFPFLIFFAFIPYLYVISKRTKLGEINKATYIMSFVLCLITLYWVGSWTSEADKFLMISGGVLLFFNPLVFLIPSTLYWLTKKYFSLKTALFALPVFWVFYEYIYTVTDFRFPWLTLGNSLPYFNSFIQIADIVGVYGLSLIVLYVNLLLYLAVTFKIKEGRINYTLSSAALLLIIIPIIYGIIRRETIGDFGQKLKIGIVQPDLNPWNKWEAGNLDDQIDGYFELSNKAAAEGAELLLWPETALPVYLLAGSYNKSAGRIFNYCDTLGIPLLTGMPHATYYFDKEKAPEYAKPLKSGKYLYTSYNSILNFIPGERKVEKYGKIMLVPFGEKVPLIDYFPIFGDFIKWNVGISSWNTGKDTTVFNIPISSSSLEKIKVGGVICIESIYPDFCASFVQRGAELLAVVTNDSWYGNSSGPYQHMAISVLRAVENRRTVVRAANGGISCLITPLGDVEGNSGLFTRTHLTVDAVTNSGLTFYSKFPRLIPLTAVWITLILIAGSLYKRFQNK